MALTRQETNRRYRHAHPEKILEDRRRYYRKNKDRIQAKHREYYRTHRQRILNRQREYYQTHRLRLLEHMKRRRLQRVAKARASIEDLRASWAERRKSNG